MTARTYTPEAIEKLVKAAEDANNWLASFIGGPDLALSEALRPFTTEPSSWESFFRETWGEGVWVAGVFAGQRGGRVFSHDEIEETRAAYRARYGVEP